MEKIDADDEIIAGLQKQRPKNESGKRFALSQEDFSKERLIAVKDEVAAMKERHPEVLSFSMFGSMAKGTMHKDSDFDGFLFVDAEKVAEIRQESSESVLDVTDDGFFFKKEISDDYTVELKRGLEEKLHLGEEFFKDIRTRPISETIIDREIERMITFYHAREKYEKDFDVWLGEEPERGVSADELVAYQKRKPQTPKHVAASLHGMFHLDIGGGIRPYRKLFVEKLIELGEDGEKIWSATIRATEMMENNLTTDETKRYPRTLQDAIRVYG